MIWKNWIFFNLRARHTYLYTSEKKKKKNNKSEKNKRKYTRKTPPYCHPSNQFNIWFQSLNACGREQKWAIYDWCCAIAQPYIMIYCGRFGRQTEKYRVHVHRVNVFFLLSTFSFFFSFFFHLFCIRHKHNNPVTVDSSCYTHEWSAMNVLTTVFFLLFTFFFLSFLLFSFLVIFPPFVLFGMCRCV